MAAFGLGEMLTYLSLSWAHYELLAGLLAGYYTSPLHIMTVAKLFTHTHMCYTHTCAPRIYSRGGQIRDLRTKVPQGVGVSRWSSGAKPAEADDRL